MSETLLLTSIAPPLNKETGVIDIEKNNWTMLCIKSWIDSGHEILSMNSQDEILVLKHLYPDINYQLAPRTTLSINNRPLVYISDLINLSKQNKHNRIAICNSDVLITKSMTGLEKPEFDNSTAFSNRINIDSTSSQSGELFYGIDYLNIHRRLATINNETLFAIGMPWWDYWYPYFSCLLNYQLIRLIDENHNPILLHKKHKDVWNPVDLCTMGKHFIDLVHNQGIVKIRSNELEKIYFQNNGDFSNITSEFYAEFARSTCKFIHQKSTTLCI